TQIVRDVMAIQVSTVASESAFSAAGRVVDPYRNRLDPDIVEALICTKDWVAAARKESKTVGSIVSDLEVEALSTVMANKLKLEEDENLWNEGLDWNAGIHMQSEDEEEQDMDSDPDVMNDADEL
ncbi:unnamed protein product, partial [Urochloa humidicola]